jgi:hypothetical protein
VEAHWVSCRPTSLARYASVLGGQPDQRSGIRTPALRSLRVSQDRHFADPGFDKDSIHGSLSDLTRLANLVEARLASGVPGSAVRIASEFAENTPYALILDLREDGFDPAAADRLLPPESDPDR